MRQIPLAPRLRAQDATACAGERLPAVSSQLEADPVRAQLQDVLRHLVLGLDVGGDHGGPPAGEELRRRDTRSREPDDHHGRSFQGPVVHVTSASAW